MIGGLSTPARQSGGQHERLLKVVPLVPETPPVEDVHALPSSQSCRPRAAGGSIERMTWARFGGTERARRYAERARNETNTVDSARIGKSIAAYTANAPPVGPNFPVSLSAIQSAGNRIEQSLGIVAYRRQVGDFCHSDA